MKDLRKSFNFQLERPEQVFQISTFNFQDLSMLRLHSLALRAPRGNFVRSIVIEPKKSSLREMQFYFSFLVLLFFVGHIDEVSTFEKESASHT